LEPLFYPLNLGRILTSSSQTENQGMTMPEKGLKVQKYLADGGCVYEI
jgi:hypothetical protein